MVKHLLLSGVEALWVDVGGLQQIEQQFCRAAIITVRPRVDDRNLQHAQVPLNICTDMVGGSI